MQPITVVSGTAELWMVLRDLELAWRQPDTTSDEARIPLGPHLDLTVLYDSGTLLGGFVDVAATGFFYDLLSDSEFDDPYAVIEQQIQEMDRVLHRLKNEAILNLGQPTVTRALDGAPSEGDEDALSFVRWHRTNATITVKVVHDDKELPVRLVVTVTPPV